MADLIDRQATIDAVSDLNAEHRVSWKDAVMDLLDELPSAQPEQRWIPCSERLPEEYDEYRITWTTSASKKRFVGGAEYEVTNEWDDKRNDFKGEWLLDDYIKAYPDVNVIAWKPIEEPYT